MNDKDKHFIEKYEELLNKGYCNCNEMNCIDNNSPRRILDIVKQLQSNWNSLREFVENDFTYDEYGMKMFDRSVLLDKMDELESGDKK